MRFRAEQHLRRQLDFQHVRTTGRRHECGAFTLWYARQATPAAVSAEAPPAFADTAAPASGVSPVRAANAATPAPEKKTPPARLGVVASRSAVGNAIQRARAKRRLREVFREHQRHVPAGYDLLLVARSSLNRLEYREIDRKFITACLKIFPPAQA